MFVEVNYSPDLFIDVKTKYEIIIPTFCWTAH